MDLHKLLSFAVQNGASDLHIQAGAIPMLRISGHIRAVDGAELSNEEALTFIASIAPESLRPRVPELRVLNPRGRAGRNRERPALFQQEP